MVKRKYSRRKKGNQFGRPSLQWYYLIPIIFAVAVVPLIVFLKPVKLEGIAFYAWKGQPINFDFFSYYKARGLLIAAGLAVLALVVKLLLKDITLRKSRLYYPLAGYGMLVVLSTIAAEYKGIALWGFPDRHEGMWVLLAYIGLLLATINMVREEKHMRLLIACLTVAAVVVGLIGIGQYTGHDFFRTELGRHLILPRKFHTNADELAFSFGSKTVYATMYNPNYVGSYMAMIMAVVLALSVFSLKWYYRLLYGTATVLIAVTWFGCNSMAGFVGGLAGMVVLLIALLRSHWRYAKFILPLGLVVCLVFVGLNHYSGGLLTRRLSLDQLTRIFDDSRTRVGFHGVKISGLRAEIMYNTIPITVALEQNQLLLYDGEGRLLELQFDSTNNQFVPKNKAYRSYRIHPGHPVVIKRGMNTFFFGIKDGHFVLLDNKQRVIDEDAKVAAWGFKGKEDFASRRGYIWSRSLPLLKDTLFLGHGPDTYAIYFPQHDYIGKTNFMGNMHILVDKPHNMYLQVAINTGLLSLALLLMLFFIYFWQSIKLYVLEKPDGFSAVLGLGCFAAVVSYLVAGLANDSVVSVAPVFWIILGLGISCNYQQVSGTVR